MKSDEEKDIVVPYYGTLPMLQADYKTEDGNVTIPKESDIRQTKRWSEELKL